MNGDPPKLDGQSARTLLELIPEPAWIFDLKGLQFLAVNSSAIEHYGYAQDKFLEMTLKDIRPNEDLPDLDAFIGGIDFSRMNKSRWRHRRADGKNIFVEVVARPVMFEGRKGRLVLARDISEMHALIEALEEQQALFSLAEKAGKMGTWAYDIASCRLISSSGTFDIFGVSHDKFPGTFDAYLSLVHEEDRHLVRKTQTVAEKGEKIIDLEYKIIRPDGEVRIVRERGAVSMDSDGRPERRVGVVTDITDQKSIAQRLSLSQSLLKLAGQIGKFGGWNLDLKSGSVFWSDEVFAIHDLPPAAKLSVKEALSFLTPQFQTEVLKAIKNRDESRAAFDEEFQITSAKGVRKWVRAIGRPVYDEHGRIEKLEGALQDVTDKRKAEERLRLIETSVNHIDDMVLITKANPIDEPGPEIIYVNEAFTKKTGFAPEEAIGKTPRILQGHGTQRDRLDRIREALTREEPVRIELLNYTKSGEEMQLELSIVPVWDERGRVTHFVSMQRDIAERITAEHELAQKELRFRAVAQATADVIWDWDIRKNLVWWNEGYSKTFGHPRPSDQMPVESWTDYIHPEDHDRVLKKINKAISTKTPQWEDEYRFLNSKGEEIPVLDRGYLLIGPDGEPDHFVGGMLDLRQRDAARAVLRKNAERLTKHIAQIRALTRSVAAREKTLMSHIARAAQTLSESDGAVIETVHGDELVYETVCGMAESKKGVRVAIDTSLSGQALRNGQTLICYDSETDERTDTLAAREVGLRSMVVTVLPGGTEPFGVLKVMSTRPNAFNEDDANFISLFAQSAGAILERRKIERRLSQAQRLEAVGQLTGGIAHDFNNLLTVILGNAETFEKEHESDGELSQIATMTRTAAERGAELTGRLLAFSRQQPLEPASTDINKLISAMDMMLRRTLGEHIEIEIVRGGGLWPAMIDAVQLESAILNLCINARDAMPDGGKLTIETANSHLSSDYADTEEEVTPGQHVMIAVSDSGTGMTEEVQSRAFEPFFTTKTAGKGSGMGLSMVFGFVKQSKGHIKLYSELQSGTTVKLYLPKAANAPDETADLLASEGVGGGEKILLVEDDDLVRGHVLSQLRSLGYKVIEARNAREALEALRQISDIELLFTDIVMPGGTNGKELAVEAVKLRPDLRVLFTSGYTENAIVHHGKLDAGVNFINKPYRKAELKKKVRQALQVQK